MTIAHRRPRLPDRLDPVRAAAGAAMARRRPAPGRQRQPWRGQRHARLGGDGRNPGCAARYGQRRGQRVACRAFHHQRGRAGCRRCRRDRGPHLSGVAAIPRGQGRCDGVRRLLAADAVGGAAGARHFHRRRLADEVHLARIGPRVTGTAAARLSHRQSSGGGRRRQRGGDAHHLPSSIQYDPAPRPHRAREWERAREKDWRCWALAAGGRRCPCTSAVSITTCACGRAMGRSSTKCAPGA